MKDVTWLNSSVNNFNGRLPIFKSDHMYQNQGRTFGPLLGLFLLNLFAKAATAKYDSYLPFRLSFDPSPWLAYNRPLASYNYHSYYPQWYPVKNPFHHETSSYQTYPTLTTTAPYVSEDVVSAPEYDTNYPEDNNYYSATTSNEVDGLIPAESKDNVASQKLPKMEETTLNPEITTKSINTIEEPIAAESSFNNRRQPPQKNRRRPTRRDKYSQKRRRSTTAPPEYYDSYEDYTERYSPNRRTRPPPVSYYDEDDYYDSFETTTKYYKKQKRRPSKKPSKNQNRKRIPPDVSYETDSEVERFGPQTEIVIVRQAIPTTTFTPLQTTTTTEPPTFIINGTTTSTTPATVNVTINQTTANGYGPSNGNEEISFTYGPPTGNRYQYQVPFFDWYSPDSAGNAIVKRVRDIVSYDKKYRLRK